MAKRQDIHKILIIGSGPIIIGQACEFDYSGTQACKALKEEGYEVVLVNSNPATIMTDPGTADKTYIESLTIDTIEKIIEIENPLQVYFGLFKLKRPHKLNHYFEVVAPRIILYKNNKLLNNNRMTE